MTTTEKPTPRAVAERLLELDGKATDGPWVHLDVRSPSEDTPALFSTAEVAGCEPPNPITTGGPFWSAYDFDFIAESRTLAPAVAKALIQAEDELATLRQRLKEAEEMLMKHHICDTCADPGYTECLDDGKCVDCGGFGGVSGEMRAYLAKHGKDGG